MEKTFSIKEALSFGWNVFKKDPVRIAFVMVGAPILLAAFSELLGFGIAKAAASELSAVSFVLSVATGIAGVIIQIGIIKVALAVVDGAEWNWKDLYQHYSLFFSFAIASFVYGVAIIGGLILLIVPGIIIAVMFGLFRYTVVDKGAGPIESLKQSRAITKGARMQVFLFALTAIGVTILGALAFFVGLLVAIPVVTIAGAWVYRQLERQTSAQVVSSEA